MAEDPKTTGTPTQDGGDAAQEPTTGTPADGGRNAEGEQSAAELEALKREKEQWLAEKANYEKLKREREQQQAQPAAPPTTPGYDERAAAALRQLQEAAAGGDVYAEVILALGQAVGQTQGAFRRELEIRDFPAERREAVQTLINEAAARGEMLSPRTAAQLLDGRELSQREAALKEREDRLAAAEAAKRDGVVATRHEPAPRTTGELPAEVTPAEYARMQSEAATIADRLKIREAERSGKLKIKPG